MTTTTSTSDRITTVTYNVAAQKILKAHEAVRDGQVIESTDLAYKGNAQATIVTEMNALVSRNHRGEISVEEYERELQNLLKRHHENVGITEELRPQLFGSADGETPLENGAGSKHETIHCGHVLPVLDALSKGLPTMTSTRTQEFNDETKLIKKTEIHEYSDGKVVESNYSDSTA